MTNFLDALRAFKSSDKTRIAVYRPSASRNNALYESLVSTLSKRATAIVVDQYFIESYRGLLSGSIDILFVPELDETELGFFRHISAYVAKFGGALVVGGQNLLMEGKALPITIFGNEEVRPNPEFFFKRSVGTLGIKPYVADVAPQRAVFDTDFVDGVSNKSIDHTLPPQGAALNTSSDRRRPFPDFGTQFTERYEVLRNYEIVRGCDAHGRHINSAVTFAQNWETGARMCVFASNNEGSFLHPETPYYAELINAAVSFCENKLIAVDCFPHYACYRQGEDVRVGYKVKNCADAPATFSVKVTIRGGKEEFSKTLEHTAATGEEIRGLALWRPGIFSTDYYDIEMQVLAGSRVVSKASNGFVVWDEHVAKKGPTMAVADDTYIHLNEKSVIITGTNYYESHRAATQWVKPNISKLRADLKQMSDFGINLVRIHYHHPKWFYDHSEYEQGFVAEAYQDLGESYLPNEAQLRTHDAHVYLCQKYGIVFSPDLFTLTPHELGDARGWIMVQDYMWFEETLACQKEFLDLLIPRYLDVPGISWDLFNEPIGPFDDTLPKFYAQFNKWGAELIAHMRSLGDTHTVTVGDNICIHGFEPISDYLSPHAFYRKAAGLKRDARKPVVLQEIWIDRPHTPEGEQLQAGDMKLALTDAFRTGLAGFAPWQWTEQLAMWQADNTYHGENWDDKLGCCVRGDATLKPAGRWYRDFIAVTADLEFISFEQFEKSESNAGPARQSGEEVANAGLSAEIVKNIGGVITTNKGLLTITHSRDVEIGGLYLKLAENGLLRRGIARKESRGEAYTITADTDCDVWFTMDVDGAFELIKADAPCTLSFRCNKTPTKVALFDRTTDQTFGAAAFEINDRTCRITIEPWCTYYWLKVTY